MSPQLRSISLLVAGLLLGAATPTLAETPDPSVAPATVSAPSVIAEPSPSSSPIPDPCADQAPRFRADATIDPTDPCPSPEPARIGLGIGPSRIIVDAGQTSGAFDVFNAGTVDMRFTLIASDFVRDTDGTWVPLPVDAIVAASPAADPGTPSVDPVAMAPATADGALGQLGAAGWLTFDAADFVLTPDETRHVSFTVAVPDDALPGDHFTGVRVVGTIGGASDAEFDAQMQGRAALKSRIAQTATVIVRVPGEAIAALSIPSLDAMLSGLLTTSTGSLTFTPQIVNAGTTAAIWMPVAGPTSALDQMVPTLRLRSTAGLDAHDELLYDGTRDADGTVTLSPLVVLPGASHTQQLTLTDAPLVGVYDYTYTLPGSTTDGRQTLTRVGSVTIVNLQKVLLWIVLPLLGLLVLLSVALMGRRQHGRRRQKAEAARTHDLQRARQEAYEQAWREQQTRGQGPW